MLAILPDNRRRGFHPDADAAVLVNEGALGCDPSDNFFGGQSRPLGWSILGHSIKTSHHKCC
jgi:hypothetical protein